MIRYECDGCGVALSANDAQRYIVKLEVYAAAGHLELTGDAQADPGRELSKVLDALAKHNFITVFDMEINSIDPYEAARSGYLYGSAPVSELTLQLETIWLRAWTTELMPIGL